MIRKFFAFLIVIAFVLVAVPVIFLFGLDRTLLNQDFYRGPLISEVYNKAMPLIADEIYLKAKGVFGKSITGEEFVVVLKNSVPASYFQEILDDAFLQLNEILDGNGKTKIVIRVDSLKPAFKNLGENILETLKQKTPVCKKNEAPRFNPLPSCVSPEFESDAYKKEYARSLDAYIAQFFANTKPIEIDAAPITQNIQQIKIIKIALQAIFASLALFALFIFLILWKPFSRGMRWVGGAMIFVAFEAFVIYKMVPILTANLNLGLKDIPQKYADAIYEVIRFAINYFDKNILYFAIAFGAIGIALVFAGYLLKPLTKK